jgi:hypothetical protein
MTDGCVQFSKNSWHYKLVHFVFPAFFWSETGRVSLCPYMRRVVISILSVIFVAGWRKLPDRIQDNAWIAQGELIFLFLVVSMAGFLDFMDTYKETDKLPIFQDLVLIGFIGGNVIGGFIAVAVLGGFALKDYIDGRPKKDHRTRGLVKTYMQSKHDKICPCVEFEDD